MSKMSKASGKKNVTFAGGPFAGYTFPISSSGTFEFSTAEYTGRYNGLGDFIGSKTDDSILKEIKKNDITQEALVFRNLATSLILGRPSISPAAA